MNHFNIWTDYHLITINTDELQSFSRHSYPVQPDTSHDVNCISLIMFSILYSLQRTCKRLWCTGYSRGVQTGCRTQHMPWADGTPCGSHHVSVNTLPKFVALNLWFDLILETEPKWSKLLFDYSLFKNINL